MELKLGDRVKDKITGFAGIITTITTYLHGCRRVGVSPEELKDGKPLDGQCFDEPQLELLNKSAYERKSDKVEQKTGGPHHQPPTPKLVIRK